MQGKMMLDTSMKFLGQGSGKTASCAETTEILNHLDRFLKPSHHLIQELKLRFLGQATKTLKNDDATSIALAKKYCRDLLEISEPICPGQSKLQGQLSHKHHLLEDIQPGMDSGLPSELVLGRAEVAAMFSSDGAFMSDHVNAR